MSHEFQWRGPVVFLAVNLHVRLVEDSAIKKGVDLAKFVVVWQRGGFFDQFAPCNHRFKGLGAELLLSQGLHAVKVGGGKAEGKCQQ